MVEFIWYLLQVNMGKNKQIDMLKQFPFFCPTGDIDLSIFEC